MRRSVGLAVVVAGFVAVVAVAGGPLNGQERAAGIAGQFVAGPGIRVFGVGPDEGLRLRSVSDDGAGVQHVRFDSTFRGVRVFGGEAIVHVGPNGKVLGVTHQHRRALGDPRPTVGEPEAVGVAWADLAPAAAPSHAPTAELVFFPSEGSYRLAWLIDAFVEDGIDDPRARVYVIDAHSAVIITSWDNLQIYTPGTGTAKVGIAKPLYLAANPATLPINTEQYTDGKYGMVDRVYFNCYTTDMLNKKTGTGTLFADADNVWGNYLTSDRATAGTDAHLGMTYTLAYFKNVHGRNGLYNDSKGVYSRVHYGRSYNNAFWSASCKCMTYGDGDGSVFSPLVSLDVAAHEMSHGVCSATANLVYSGESGGLNESNSDIFGAAVEFYAASAKDVGDWWIGEMIYTPATAGDALRYMDTPKRDGRSIDHYSLYTSTMDVHYSSGLANNWFYLLANGGTNQTSGIAVTGIGISDAQRIWYVALTGYMTSTTTFAQARTATVNAATQLFGSTSNQVQRVKDAWTAVGVN
ncbi:MAG: M4 family metallopeptidase [Acidobacteriota bacterium]